MSFPRYPTYKDSGVEWLGEVPEHWEVWKLSHAFTLIGSGTTPKTDNRDYYDGGEIPWVNTGDLNDRELDECKKRITALAITEHSALTIYPAGSLLIAMYGATIGKLALLNFAATVNQACCVFTGKSEIASKFMFYWFLGLRQQIISLATGGGQPNISQDILRSLQVAIPPLSQQRQIATFLDHETAKIDALIAEQQRLIELLQEKRQAVISHAVTKGLNPDAPMKDSGVEWLGEVPEHWDVAPLKHHWLVTDCKHVTAEFTQEGYPLASIKEAQGRWIDLTNAKRTTDEFYKLLTEGSRTPEPGDLVFTRNATVGEVAEVPAQIESFALGQDVVILKKLKGSHCSSFAWHLLRSTAVSNQLECAMIGSTFRRINVEQIKAISVPIPPSHEQASIAIYLEEVSDQWSKQEQDARHCVSLLQERRSALISAAVTGQIDVRGLVPEAEAA
jgi:type I restriction enzyme S subunit